MRDSQRSKVYKADHSLDCYGRLETIPEIERFVHKLWCSTRFQREFPRAFSYYGGEPKVGDGRARRRASGGTYSIKMPIWSRTYGIVCHELAHTVHMRERLGGAVHGWEYCSVYLRLVQILMGTEAHDRLKAAFKAQGVRYKPKAKRPVSDERRAQLRANMEKARAARVKTIPQLSLGNIQARWVE